MRRLIKRVLLSPTDAFRSAAQRLLDNAITAAYADGGTFKQSNYNATIDRILAAMNAFGTIDLSSKIHSWVDPEYLPYWQSTAGGTASNSGCRKLYDLFRRADFVQTNTPSMPLLLLHSGENYWWNGGVASNYCSTPNAAANQITSDICFTAYIQPYLLNITPAVIVAKYGTSGNRAFQFRLNNATLQLLVSVGGIDSTATSSTNVPFAANQPFYVRAFRQASNGQVTFWTSSDGITWNQLGTTQSTTSGSIDNVSQLVEVGSNTTGTLGLFNGRIFSVSIQTSVGGSDVVTFNPQSFTPSTSQTQWTSATGEVWTINTSLNTSSAQNSYKGALVYRNMIMADGIDDSMASGNITIGGQQFGVYGSARLLNNITSTNVFLELSANFNSNSKSFALLNGNASASRKIQLGTQNGGNYNVNFNTSGDVFTQRMQLISGEIDTSLAAASENKIFVNGVSFTMTNSPSTDMSFSFDTSYPLNLFGRAAANFANMSLHDLILVTDITKRTEMENIIRSMSSNFAF